MAHLTHLTPWRPTQGLAHLAHLTPGPQLGLSSPVETPVFQAHGDQDQVVSYNRGKITSQVGLLT